MNANVCWTCEALRAPAHLPFDEDVLGALRSDHQFAQHARQMDLFDTSKEFGDDPIIRILEEAHVRKGGDEYTAARAGLEEATAKVNRGIDPEFRRIARELLVEIAKYQPILTSDDIWQKMPEHMDLAHYREARHMSDILKWGVREGYIERNDRYVPSKSPKANMVPHNQWRSLLFGRTDRW